MEAMFSAERVFGFQFQQNTLSLFLTIPCYYIIRNLTSCDGRCKILRRPGQETKCAPSFFSLLFLPNGLPHENLGVEKGQAKKKKGGGEFEQSHTKRVKVQLTEHQYQYRILILSNFCNYLGQPRCPTLMLYKLLGQPMCPTPMLNKILGRPGLPLPPLF